MEIPDWLKHKQDIRYGDRLPKEGFLHKTLKHILSFTNDTVFNKEVSERKGFLHRIEPRLKLICFSLLIVGVSLQRHPEGIGVFFAFLVAIAFASFIPLGLLFKRLLPVFLITSLIALPAIFNIFVDGRGIVTVFRFQNSHSIGHIYIPQNITITEQGVMSALTLILRVVTSLVLVFLQTLTTPPEKLIKAVSFFLPGAFKSIFSISYRYIFFLIKRLEEFITAYRARSISGSSKQGRRWASFRIGSLFSVSLRLTRDLEMTMKSRGMRFGSKE
ncbi:MAG: hypothetical protein HY805_07535 [Nitrospirae bacterium]|nr:hypothetical protein [Nitrospirota bacterium]